MLKEKTRPSGKGYDIFFREILKEISYLLLKGFENGIVIGRDSEVLSLV
jgi:hypothetical protein